MKRILPLFLAIVMALTATAENLGFQGSAQDQKHLTAVFSYATFYHPQTGPYLETYLSFDAWNLNFVKHGDAYQATVEVIITISQKDSIELVKKYNLNSPKIMSLDNSHFNFLDMQRMAIANGIHDMSITLRDLNSNDEPVVIKQQLAFYYDRKHPALSSVQMMSSAKPTTTPNILSRSGYDMEPYVNDFLPEQINQIHYYYEIYNINRETRKPFVYAVSYIEILETGKVLEATQSVQKLATDTLIPFFGSLDIATLPSGNYNLVVELRNESNDIMLYRRVPFFRSNPSVADIVDQTPVSLTFAGQIQNEATLNEYIEALAPIANEMERRDIYDLIRRPGLEEKQLFLYKFWVKRSPIDAESLWRDYRDRIEYVNANFSWPKTKGIHTDRGRVYLQYGPPDFVRDEKNFVSIRYMGGGVNVHTIGDNDNFHVKDLQAAKVDNQGQIFYLPYQLWRYNQIPGDDPNRCFIFWDEFRSGFYKLLNSNAKGEVREAKWEQRLSQQQLNEDLQGEVGDQFERGY
ncbi:MAG: GWxTD domain-containing protein [Bacteroidales bacterium]|nr:GWxTD domain-containing protein [Bacteroidales bacterium]